MQATYSIFVYLLLLSSYHLDNNTSNALLLIFLIFVFIYRSSSRYIYLIISLSIISNLPRMNFP